MTEDDHQRLREAFYDERVSYDDVVSILGPGEAQLMMMLRDNATRYDPDEIPAADIDIPPQDEFYDDLDAVLEDELEEIEAELDEE